MSIEQKIAEILEDATIQEEGDFVKDTEHAEPGSIKQPEVATDVIARTKKQQAKVGATPESGEGKEKPTPGQEGAPRRMVHAEDITVDVSQDVQALVEGEELTEEFKTKAATIFEAAVVTRVREEISKLEEQYDSMLEEELESITEGLVDQVDGYLNYVVEQWMADNELALENGVKLEIMESFMQGMKSLFEQHYIDVPEEKYDALAEAQEELDEMNAKLDALLESNVELTEQIEEMHKAAAIAEAAEGMTAVDTDKFTGLAEELSYDDAMSFKAKLTTIKENYFGKKPTAKVSSVVSDEPVSLNEETEVTGPMAAYLKALNRTK